MATSLDPSLHIQPLDSGALEAGPGDAAGLLEPAHPMQAGPLELAHGRQLRLTSSSLEIRAPGGGLEVEVRITADGPVLRLLTPRLAVEGLDALAIRCQSLSVETQTRLTLESAGALEVSAGLDLDVRAGGELRQNAPLIRIN